MNAKALRRTSIMMILGTNLGERVGEPTFGSKIHEKMFEPNDGILLQEVRAETIDAIQRWDPLVHIIGAACEPGEDRITVHIDYVDLTDRKQDLNRVAFTMRRS